MMPVGSRHFSMFCGRFCLVPAVSLQMGATGKMGVSVDA